MLQPEESMKTIEACICLSQWENRPSLTPWEVLKQGWLQTHTNCFSQYYIFGNNRWFEQKIVVNHILGHNTNFRCNGICQSWRLKGKDRDTTDIMYACFKIWLWWNFLEVKEILPVPPIFHASVRLEIFKTIVSRQNGKCTKIIFLWTTTSSVTVCYCLWLKQAPNFY